VAIALKMAASTLRLPKRYLSGSAVPSIQNQVRGSRRNQSHSSQAGPLGLPRALLRDEIRRQRRSALPGAAPAVTDQAAQQESREPGISTHPSSSSLKNTSFWGRLLVTYLDRSLKGPRL
jgi:hypothetical protein